MKTKTYKVRGVEFSVNEFGYLEWCSDWETLYEPNGRERHRGTNRDLFRPGFGGGFFATNEFKNLTGYKSSDVSTLKAIQIAVSASKKI